MCVAYLVSEFAGSTENTTTGSRRLLTYRRLPDSAIRGDSNIRQREAAKGNNANDLNSFRKRVSILSLNIFARIC